jgi:hypothetical protein
MIEVRDFLGMRNSLLQADSVAIRNGPSGPSARRKSAAGQKLHDTELQGSILVAGLNEKKSE